MIKRAPDWIATAPVQIRKEAVISAAPDKVWSALADNGTWPDWFPGFKACKFTSLPPHGEGSQRLVHQDAFKVEEIITLWETGRAWGMTVSKINAPVLKSMSEQVFLTPQGPDTTHIDWRIGIDLAWLGRILKGPLVGKTTQSLEQALINLDQKLSSKA